MAAIHGEWALVQAGSLFGRVTRHRERLRALVDSVLAEPGNLGAYAVQYAVNYARSLAHARGDREGAEQALERGACVREGWRAAGPFGPFALLSFDEEQPALGRGPLADQYDLGPGREEEETRDIDAPGCTLALGQGRGSTIAETTIEVPQDGTYFFGVSTSASFKFYIDGTLVHTVDRRSRLHPTQVAIQVPLTAGSHELELKVTSRGGARVTMILDWDGRLGEGYEPGQGTVLPQPQGTFERVLMSTMMRLRGDALGARTVLGDLGNIRGGLLALTAYEGVLRADPFLARERLRELTQQIGEQITERDPNAVYAALAEAGRIQGDAERSAAIRVVAERWPDVLSTQTALVQLLLQDGQLAAAEQVISRLREQFPHKCFLISRLRSIYREQQRVADAAALVEDLVRCDAGSNARFELLRGQRRWAEALTELERLAPFIDNDDRVRALRLDIAIATDDREEEARLRAAIDADQTEPDPRQVLRAIDGSLSEGQRGAAVRSLQSALEEEPEAMAGLRQLRRDLTGESDFEPYRQDGREVIARYEAGEIQHPDAPQVLVFDYMVTRVYSDGSARNLIHQIYRVQSEEAVERLGQLSLGGHILTLRSIKPDGRIMEPEAIAGLDSIPMSELAVGDYVEYEYVTGSAPRYNGGYRSNGWSFDSSEHPFAFSQLVAVVPTEMPLTVEALGGTPAAEERVDGDLRVYTWTMEHVPPQPPEPRAVPVPPYRPTLHFGFDAGWETLFEPLREALLGRDLYDPEAAALAQEIIGEAQTDREKAERLFRWVREEIEPADGFTESAPLMVSLRRGTASRVLRYLLTLVGVDARLVLGHGFGQMEPGELSRTNLYNQLLVQVVPEAGEPFVLWPERYVPFGYIPMAAAGQNAVVILGNEALTTTRIPESSPTQDRHQVRAQVRFEGGDAFLAVEEQFHGDGAIGWRRELERVPAAELERVLSEAYVPRVLPGAEVRALEVAGTEDADAPVVLRYQVRVRNFGRNQGNALLVPSLFGVDLSRQYASLPSRTTSMFMGPFLREVEVRLEGVRTTEQPPVDARRGNMAYTRQVTQDATGVTLQRRVQVERAVVGVADYAATADFARQISVMESLELPIQSR